MQDYYCQFCLITFHCCEQGGHDKTSEFSRRIIHELKSSSRRLFEGPPSTRTTVHRRSGFRSCPRSLLRPNRDFSRRFICLYYNSACAKHNNEFLHSVMNLFFFPHKSYYYLLTNLQGYFKLHLTQSIVSRIDPLCQF